MGKELTVMQQKAVTVRDYINQPYIIKQLEAALPKFLTAERFLRSFYSALLRNPALFDCSKESMLSAMIESAQLGLEPILRKAALVPYKNEVQFQPMYGGLMELARRTAQIKITGHVVYEKDDFDIAYGTDDRLHHKPFMGEDPGEMIGAYTVWTFEGGFQTFLFMPTHQIYKVRAISKAWQKAKREPNNSKAQETPWVQWEDQQSIKTAIKRHSKLQPCSIEMARAIELDDQVEAGLSQSDILGKLDYPTGSPAKTEAKGEEPEQHLIEKFDLKVKEKDNVDLDNLKGYLKLSAETQEGLTTDSVKAFVVTKGFNSFWGFYESWEGYKKADKKPEYSAFVQQFIKLRKGDGVKTGLGPAILKNKAAIQATPPEDQEIIRKKFYTLYGPEVSYPLDPPGEKETKREDKPDPDPTEEQDKILELVKGAEITDVLNAPAIVVECPDKDHKPTVKWCNSGNCKVREGCDSWKNYDAQVG